MNVLKERDILATYLTEMAQNPLLTRQEMVELAKRVEQGDEEARQKLIKCNLKLAYSVAKKYARGSPQILLDLIQEGNLGLFRAVERFNWRRRIKFSTYAQCCILSSILDALRKQFKTIATAKNIKISSLHHPANEDMEKCLYYLDEDRSEPDPSQSEIVNKAMEKLNWKEQLVLSMRFGLRYYKPHTLKEISEKFKVSHEAIHQIQRRALEKMRQNKKIRMLM